MKLPDSWQVSIVTPTFPGREQELMDRCIPSVNGQDWRGPIEHVIVSDRNHDLGRHFWEDRAPYAAGLTRRFVQINETWRNPTTEASTGAYPWMIGSRLALGEFVGFLGDDDELLPHHVRTHVEAMRKADATWSLSKVDFRVGGQPYLIIGDESYDLGHLDSTGIMCWKGALQVATWNPNGENASDWQLVRDWRAAGLKGVFVDEVTGIHHDGWAAGKSGRPDRLGGGY